MEKLIKVRIEKLPEGVYLATSEDVPGLVAQGSTVAETLDIARDVARILLEEAGTGAKGIKVSPIEDVIELSLVVAAG